MLHTMKTSTIIWVIVIVLIIAGGWWYFSSGTSNTSPSQLPIRPLGQTQTINNAQGRDYMPNPRTSTSSNTTSSALMSATVTVTSSGFSPTTVTIKKGGTITWIDKSGSPMWIASAAHPTHAVYDNTSKNEHCASGYSGPTPFDECSSSSGNYSFIFNQVGTWKYHNHVNVSEIGTVIVK